MYQIQGKQANQRLSENEVDQFNEIARAIQEEKGIEFKNSKDVVFALIEFYENNKLLSNSNETTTEDIPVINEPSPKRQELISAIGYEIDPTDDQLYSDCLSIITTPLETPEPQVVEKEVKVEIEKTLSKGEYVIALTEPQDQLLQHISRWRKMYGYDKVAEPIPELMKKLVFNEGTLTNDHGCYDTGISSKKAKSVS